MWRTFKFPANFNSELANMQGFSVFYVLSVGVGACGELLFVFKSCEIIANSSYLHGDSSMKDQLRLLQHLMQTSV